MAKKKTAKKAKPSKRKKSNNGLKALEQILKKVKSEPIPVHGLCMCGECSTITCDLSLTCDSIYVC